MIRARRVRRGRWRGVTETDSCRRATKRAFGAEEEEVMKRCLGFGRNENLGFLKVVVRFVEESEEEKESVVAILVVWFV